MTGRSPSRRPLPGRPTPSGAPHDRAQAGSASLIVVVLVAAVTVAALVAAILGRLLVEHRRASAAADLAALAAAGAIQAQRPACPAAAAVADGNRARLVACKTDGEQVSVEVSVLTPLIGWGTVSVHARARAGPVSGHEEAAHRRPTAPSSARPRRPRQEASRSTRSKSRTAPCLSRGALPLPHLGDCTQEGHPASQAQLAMVVRVASSQARALR